VRGLELFELFTGLVDDVGVVERVERTEVGRELRISSRYTGLTSGESVAVNGACLTVRTSGPGWFVVAAVVTTLGRTTIGDWDAGRRVNLERAMRLGDRLGGHLVQGHVDGVGKLIDFERIAESENWWLHIELPDDVEKYTVYKGSISIEGISLTVAKLERNRCTIAIIPHTVEATNLHSLKAGDPVNLEADLIAKYVEKMMRGEASENSLTVEDLVQQGF